MAVSVFDLFKIGIGPSSSHTVGPMRAAALFLHKLDADGMLDAVTGIDIELYGSLGATGKGHGSDKAIFLGLEGEDPETVDIDSIAARIGRIRAQKSILLLGRQPVAFDPDGDLVFHRNKSLPEHPNGMTFMAWRGDKTLLQQTSGQLKFYIQQLVKV